MYKNFHRLHLLRIAGIVLYFWSMLLQLLFLCAFVFRLYNERQISKFLKLNERVSLFEKWESIRRGVIDEDNTRFCCLIWREEACHWNTNANAIVWNINIRSTGEEYFRRCWSNTSQWRSRGWILTGRNLIDIRGNTVSRWDIFLSTFSRLLKLSTILWKRMYSTETKTRQRSTFC